MKRIYAALRSTLKNYLPDIAWPISGNNNNHVIGHTLYAYDDIIKGCLEEINRIRDKINKWDLDATKGRILGFKDFRGKGRLAFPDLIIYPSSNFFTTNVTLYDVIATIRRYIPFWPALSLHQLNQRYKVYRKRNVLLAAFNNAGDAKIYASRNGGAVFDAKAVQGSPPFNPHLTLANIF